jgi:hypothetical protein
MSKSDDDILASEIGKAGALGGKIGGGQAGALGGRLGGQWVAKLLPNDTYEISNDVVAELTTVISTITNLLNNKGKLLGTQETSGIFEIKGLVGSGFFNMNPAILTIWIKQETQKKVQITIRGTAKEGLIKQHTAEKAVLMVAQYLE